MNEPGFSQQPKREPYEIVPDNISPRAIPREGEPVWSCPECGHALDFFPGQEKPYLLCPDCRDVAYDFITGEKLGGLKPTKKKRK